MEYAYKTTVGWIYRAADGEIKNVDHPKPPDQEDTEWVWEMCGSSIGQPDDAHDQPILWFWRRRVG